MLNLRGRSGASLLCGCIILATIGEATGQFTTVLNIPPDPNIGNGVQIGSDTQLNLFDGGSVGSNFATLGPNVEFNIFGGSVGGPYRAWNGSTVNIYGGSFGGIGAHYGSTLNISGGIVQWFDTEIGSEVNILGGTIGGWRTDSGSAVNISGGEFRIDGQIVEGLGTPGDTLAVNVPDGSVLSGTLADGTPLIAASRYGNFADETHMLTAAELPVVGPSVITLPADPAPRGVRTGQTLVVEDGGVVGDYFNAGFGSNVNVGGGEVGRGFWAIGAQVNIAAGTVGSLEAFVGTRVDLSGGALEGSFGAYGGSDVTITGGSIGRQFSAHGETTVSISGGLLTGGLVASENSRVSISGGTVNEMLYVEGSNASISGGAIAELKLDRDSTVEISGGVIGAEMEQGYVLVRKSELRISGGTLWDEIIPVDNSTLSVSGGLLFGGIEMYDSTVYVSGGSLGGTVMAYGTVMNISGGTFSDVVRFVVGSGSVSLFGTQFILDSSDISAVLTPYEPFTIIDRDVTLAGLLADGESFSFDLNTSPGDGDRFQPDVKLTVTLVQPGDTNFDGLVDVDDLNNVRNHFGQTGNADGTLPGDAVPWDGVVDIDDLNAVRNNFGAGVLPVPEPGGLAIALLLLSLFCGISRRRRD